MDFPQLPSRVICDRARYAKDARFDGLFFTAVRSTGIYCRPVCPAPMPKAQNVAYYPTAAAATAAGYRPCLRCRPELSPEARHAQTDETVRRALELIAEGMLQDAPVAALAARVGVSARQLQRLFATNVGANPHAVHATRRLLLAKQLLTETAMPVTDIALASGFNSLRRFNAAFLDGCAMPPGAIRRQHLLRRDARAGKRGREDDGDAMTLRLVYRPPLDFRTMLAFLGKRAIPGIECVTEDAYERMIGTAQAPARLRVRADDDRSELRLDLWAADPRAIPDLVRRVRRMFDLDADLQTVHATLSADPLLAAAIARRPGLRVPCGWDGFELAVRAVLGQQISVAGATTLARRLVDAYGEHCETPAGWAPGLGRLFPTPQRLRDAPLESLGLPRTRAQSLRALSAAVADGALGFEGGQRPQDFIARCVALPGIGAWTAQYIAMRALALPDAFPAGDLVLQQVLGGARRLSERETEARSQTWRPWRAYAVLHLWHAASELKTSTTRSAA